MSRLLENYWTNISMYHCSPIQGKKQLSAPFLMPAKTKILVLLSALVERFGVSLMPNVFIQALDIMNIPVSCVPQQGVVRDRNLNFFFTKKKGVIIGIGLEILCLPHVGFLFSNSKIQLSILNILVKLIFFFFHYLDKVFGSEGGLKIISETISQSVS